MTNYKMLLQYDGSRYSGWQKQGNTENTIQGKLETIATRLTGVPTDVNGSGRTDAGVHALGQVANFKGDIRGEQGEEMSCTQIRDYFNQTLPLDIRVVKVSEAAPRFHARLNASKKHYRYTVDCGEVADVFTRKYTARISADYDIESMEKAAELLLGEHDFKSFCENKHMKKSTIRTIYGIYIHYEKEVGMLTMDFWGNGFLYHMVRILAGTLLEVGDGRRSPEDIPRIIEEKTRLSAGFTAPAQGLSLVEVEY